MNQSSTRPFKVLMIMLIISALVGPQYFFKELSSLVSEATAAEGGELEIWWPTEGAVVTGIQPFQGMLPNRSVSDYVMYWQVDDGERNQMESNYNNYPHKEAGVDLSGWNWRGIGPYKVTVSAYDLNNQKLVERSVTIYTGQSTPNQQTNVTTQTSEVASSTQTIAPIPLVAEAQAAVTSTNQNRSVEVWWPTHNATITGTQPFKGVLQNSALGEYDLYWQVDGGGLNPMTDSQQDYPHKEAIVSLDSWNWRGAGPYTVSFVAKDKSGTVIGSTDRTIYTAQNTAQLPIATTDVAINKTKIGTASGGNPLASWKLYVNPNSPAKRQADSWRSSRPADAAKMDKLAAQPQASWFGGWTSDVYTAAKTATEEAARTGSVPTFISYNIPQRDCGGYSAGGAGSEDGYRTWIKSFADGIGANKAIVILEPDALAQVSCLSGADQTRRLNLLSEAVSIFKSKGNIAVYLDAGHAGWVPASEMADRLKRGGIDKADGFALNVSNFVTTADNANYGNDLSGKVGGKHFIIDTSRNGNGATNNNEWCNPPGRAVGQPATTNTGSNLIDAYLWLKTPGESDGSCNGGPSAGTWWPEYGLGLIERAGW